MKKTAVDRLIWEGKAQDLNFLPETKEYKVFSRELEAARLELEALLPEKHKRKVQLLIDAVHRVCDEEDYEAFRQGYSLGTRLTAEAFLIGEEKEE